MPIEHDRRSFLIRSKKLLYGGAAVALAGGSAWRAADRDIFSAGGIAPQNYLDRARAEFGVSPQYFCAAGALAASILNSQPWEFRIENNQILVFADLARWAQGVDADAYQLFVSIGCAIANIEIAARANGKTVRTSLVLDESSLKLESGELVLVAQIEIGDGGAEGSAAELLAEIPRRRTSRHSHDLGHSIPGALINALSTAARGPQTRLGFVPYTDHRHINLAALIERAIRKRAPGSGYRSELGRWFRCTDAAAMRHKDGIHIDAIGVSPIYLPAWKFWRCPTPERLAEFDTDILLSRAPFSNFLGAMTVPKSDFSLKTAVEAGRAWQVMSLVASKGGLALQPISALPSAMGDPRGDESRQATEEFQKIVRLPGWRPVLAFRMGRATAYGFHSPRRDLKSLIAG